MLVEGETRFVYNVFIFLNVRKNLVILLNTFHGNYFIIIEKYKFRKELMLIKKKKKTKLKIFHNSIFSSPTIL